MAAGFFTYRIREFPQPFWHLKSLRYRIFIFFLLLFFSAASRGLAGDLLEVTVTGITGEVYDNIMARLRIHLLSRNSDIEEAEIRRLHRLAPEDIKNSVAPYGYHSPKIESSLSATSSGWKATYNVVPGNQVYITKISVSITGPGSTKPELLHPLEFISIQEGNVLNHPLYEQEKRKLLTKVVALGYLKASYIIHELRIDRKEYSAEIELVLDTGPLYLFGEITSDQKIITDDLFQRFIQFERGDPFDPLQLQQLQRELYRTDYFGMVSVIPETQSPDSIYVPITIATQPLEKSNTFSVGVGYATDTGANARFDWKNKLLNRKGHNAFSSFLIGDRESHLLFNYRIPVRDPRFNTFTGTTKWSRERWEDTDTQKFSVAAVYEYRNPTHYAAMAIQGINEEYSIGSTSDRGRFLIPGIQGAITVADDIISTSNGFRGSLDLEGASDKILSDASFLKIRLNGQAITTPLKNWRLIGRGTIGTILVNSIDEIPPSLRFYAGGEKSVRGYYYRTLGPEDDSGNIVGGRVLLAGSIACERQFLQHWRISAFYDVGNALDDWSSLNLAQGIGVGVGLALPFGQARLELAYPLSDEGSPQYVYIRIGADL